VALTAVSTTVALTAVSTTVALTAVSTTVALTAVSTTVIIFNLCLIKKIISITVSGNSLVFV
jgi:hypothetical protein